MCPAGEHQHQLTSVFDLHPAVTTGQRGDLLYVPEPEPEEIDAVYAGAKQIAPIGWSVQPGGCIGFGQAIMTASISSDSSTRSTSAVGSAGTPCRSARFAA